MTMDGYKYKEFAIAITAQSHNPTILNPDFLKNNEIVPADWELDQDIPQFTSFPVSQVAFKNGISIKAQLDRIIFSQIVLDNEKANFSIPDIALRYVKKLPYVSYTAIGINPSATVKLSSTSLAENFIVDNYIMDGPWKLFGGIKPIVSTTFIYSLSDVKIRLFMDVESLNKGSEEIPLILFSSNFHRDLLTKEPVKMIENIIGKWEIDLDTFNTLMHIFLKKD